MKREGKPSDRLYSIKLLNIPTFLGLDSAYFRCDTRVQGQSKATLISKTQHPTLAMVLHLILCATGTGFKVTCGTGT